MSIIYVSKDAERATGVDLDRYGEFYILTNRSPLADALYYKYPKRVLLNDDKYLSTLELLKLYSSTIRQIDPRTQIMVFKNSRQIERFCEQQGWRLLNPAAALTEKFEHKLSQANWFNSLKLSAAPPESLIAPLEKLKFEELVSHYGNPFILQYNLGHTGEGTKIITSPYELENEINLAPKRAVKISHRLFGKTYTINVCVCPNEIHVGRIALQLTGHPQLTDNRLATVGNDWTAAADLYSPAGLKTKLNESYIPDKNLNEYSSSLALQIIQLAREIGQAMRLERWQGLFGLDVLVEENTHKLFLLEVNARQQSGATFESQVAHVQGAAGPLDWHLHCLSGTPLAYPLKQYEIPASQIFCRLTNSDFYNKLSQVEQIGEYTTDIRLVAEKTIFDLPPENKNLFLIPQATPSEPIRVQSNNDSDTIINTLI